MASASVTDSVRSWVPCADAANSDQSPRRQHEALDPILAQGLVQRLALGAHEAQRRIERRAVGADATHLHRPGPVPHGHDDLLGARDEGEVQRRNGREQLGPNV